MAVLRLQCEFARDTAFARDRLVITPHFNDQGVGSDETGLCTDLAAALNTWDNGIGEIRVTSYDAQGTPPVFPNGEAVINEGLSPASPYAREVAVCLSFYSGQNRPRYRGRLFIPTVLAGITPAQARPSLANRQKVADLATIFADLGGPDVDWCVYSRVDNVARSVSHWWVDDAWDIQRSRGLSPTTRLTGAVNE